MTADETTPLIRSRSRSGSGSDATASLDEKQSWLRRIGSVENRILFSGFLITLSFSYTQVALFHVFFLMECDVYYDEHPNPPPHHGKRCGRDEITAGTATMVSILGMTTTICGIVNLFIAGWTSKKFGPRAALVCQTFVPGIRVAVQVLGVVAGKRAGMLIIQASQLITILGGPSGYILITNVIAGEVVEPVRRTVVFGMLQGAIMLGQGLGYLVGGIVGDAIDIKAPFELAFISFLVSTLYVQFAMPYISPESMSNAKKDADSSGGLAAFFAPLKILSPQRLRLADGRIRKHYGVIFLCAGIFVGVVATGYAPVLIQMYAMAVFDFSQGDNGWLIAEFSFIRSLFLMILFPRIISLGRRLSSRKKEAAAAAAAAAASTTTETEPLLESSSASSHTDVAPEPPTIPRDPAAFDIATEQADQEPVQPPSPEKGEDLTFDLTFLRWSLVVDGALTTLAALATKRWHIYLAALLLPFGSGSAPAAKGVITDMCSDAQRADALNAVTLVENVAKLSTQGLFGFVFSSLAGVGMAYATFFCNAAVAVVGAGVLLFSHFPPVGAYVIDKESVEDEETDAVNGESVPVARTA